MKSVLIIDGHPLFQEFIKDKLEPEKVEVIPAVEDRDAFTKTITNLPNLIIMDRDEFQSMESDYLEKKAMDQNTQHIPVIITGPIIDKALISSMARYGVIKYFAKPIKFDLLFESISKVLRVPIIMDDTPCVLDIHRNGNIIFIEVAQGLNREKLALLKFKLSEIIEAEEMDNPKIVIMLTQLDLSFVDGLNVEYLIDNVLAHPKIHRKNVKILSLSPFVHELVDGHEDYSEIEVSNNLANVMTTLVDSTITSSVSDLITDHILSGSDSDEETGSIETRFSSDSNSENSDADTGSVFSVALIDNIPQSAEFIRQTFAGVGAKVEVFANGNQFMENYEPNKYSLLILDVLQQDSNGFDIMRQFRGNPSAPPVVVYTQSAQRDLIVRTLSYGASLYITKPQKPEALLNKCVQLLHQRI